MIKTTIVKMTPQETTTEGYLKIKEWGQPMLFKFQQDPDFRGKLSSVEWNTDNGEKHRLTAEDEDFALFSQVGERPEVEVPSSWFEGLGLGEAVLLRLRFEFETFRMEPVWYGYLYLKTQYGDMDLNSKAAYKLGVGASGVSKPDCCYKDTDKCCGCCDECYLEEFDDE